MSVTFCAGLFGEVPSVEALTKRLDDLGGVEGDWDDRVVCAGVSATVDEDPDPELLENLAAALAGKAQARPVVSVVIVDGRNGEAIEALGNSLVSSVGGVFVCLDDLSVVAYAPGPTPARKGATRPKLDLSIPASLPKSFRIEKNPYRLAARDAATFTGAWLLKQLPTRPSQSSAASRLEQIQIGPLVLAQRHNHELSWYAAELRTLGVQPQSLFVLKYEHWFQDGASPDDWSAMLALVCGLARATRGVLYHVDDDRVVDAFDFERGTSPDVAPPPAVPIAKAPPRPTGIASYIERFEDDPPRHRVHVRGPFVAVLSGYANSNAAGLGPFEDALACIERELDGAVESPTPDSVYDRLTAASEAIVGLNATNQIHQINADATVVWDQSAELLAVAHCGGGHVYALRGGDVLPLCAAQTLARQARDHAAEQGTDPDEAERAIPDYLRRVAYTRLGNTAEIETAFFTRQPHDRLIVICGADDRAADHVPALRDAATERDLDALTRRLGAHLTSGGARQVAVVAIDLDRRAVS